MAAALSEAAAAAVPVAATAVPSMFGALYDTFWQLYGLVYNTASSAILLAILSLIASLIGYVALTGKDFASYYFQKFFGKRYVEIRVETPDELFFWINRWIISLPSYAKQTRFETNKKKKPVLADDSGGQIYFTSGDLNSYRICSERAMMREQAGMVTQRKYAGLAPANKQDAEDDRWSIVFLPGNSNHELHFKGKLVSVITGPEATRAAAGGGAAGAAAGGGRGGLRGMASAAWGATSGGGGGGGGGGSSANKDKQVLLLRTEAQNLAVLHDLVQEAITYSRSVHERKIYLWRSTDSYSPYLTIQGEYDPDTFCHPELPILPVNTVKTVLDDVGRFLKSEDFYHRMGVPYRRGYLLYGVPGTGKTTLVRKIAAAHKLDVCMISLGGGRDSFLSQLFANAPKHSILLLEDVDVAFPSADIVSKRAEEKKKAAAIAAASGAPAPMKMGGRGGGGSEGMTMSGLFNAIDGIEAQTGCILIMTTNHIEHLDSALIRSGRIDVKIHFDYCARRECALAYHRFYPDMALTVPDDGETKRLQRAEADRNKTEEAELRKLTRQVSTGLGLVREPSGIKSPKTGGADSKDEPAASTPALTKSKSKSKSKTAKEDEPAAATAAAADSKSAPTLVVDAATPTAIATDPTTAAAAAAAKMPVSAAAAAAAAAAAFDAAEEAELAAEEAKLQKSPEEEERERVALGVSKLAYAFGKRAARMTRKPRLTMSDIQGHLLKYRDSPLVAYAMIDMHDARSTAKAAKDAPATPARANYYHDDYGY